MSGNWLTGNKSKANLYYQSALIGGPDYALLGNCTQIIFTPGKRNVKKYQYINGGVSEPKTAGFERGTMRAQFHPIMYDHPSNEYLDSHVEMWHNLMDQESIDIVTGQTDDLWQVQKIEWPGGTEIVVKTYRFYGIVTDLTMTLRTGAVSVCNVTVQMTSAMDRPSPYVPP